MVTGNGVVGAGVLHHLCICLIRIVRVKMFHPCVILLPFVKSCFHLFVFFFWFVPDSGSRSWVALGPRIYDRILNK